MKVFKCYFSILFLFFVSSGCAGNVNNVPLLFGEAITFGVSISGSAPEQGGEFTLGFKSKDIAIVPVSRENTLGEQEPVESQAPDGSDKTFTDSYSVLGQFSANSGTQRGSTVSLGKFFATGLAARNLAEGFACQLSNGKHQNCKANNQQNDNAQTQNNDNNHN